MAYLKTGKKSPPGKAGHNTRVEKARQRRRGLAVASPNSSKEALKAQPSVPTPLDAEYLRVCFRYDPQTGELSWRKRPKEHFSSESIWRMWNTKYALKEAGRKRGDGLGKEYRSVCLNHRHLQSHNVIWCMATGQPPTQLIDHINGSGLDNSWGNLREVSHKENNKNRRRGTTNKTGVVGVSWCKWSSKWRAQVAVNGKNKALGRYRDFFDAVCARKSADVKYGYHVNHGSVRPL